MVPKIGYSVLNLRKFSEEVFPFETYELRASSIRPNIKKIIGIKNKFKDTDLSIHSGLSRIFSCVKKGYPEFVNHELDILKYEIAISKIIGIKRINFHMTDYKLENNEIEKFKEIINFARKNGIELIYENHVCSADSILYILEKFPELNMCLDIGHLNIAIHNNLFKMNLNEFIEKVKSKIVHLHIHNNEGEKDSHNGLNNGTLDWKNILLKLQNVEKAIIEVKDTQEVLETKKILEKFYKRSK